MKEVKASDERLLYQFDEYVIAREERILLRDGLPVPLTPKAFETLLVLVENSGRVLTKEEMLQRVWPDTTVEETTLAQNIFTLRKALGSSGQQLIQTIPKRGYRFTANPTLIHKAALANGARSDQTPEEPETVAAAQPQLAGKQEQINLPLRARLLPYQLAIALLFILKSRSSR